MKDTGKQLKLRIKEGATASRMREGGEREGWEAEGLRGDWDVSDRDCTSIARIEDYTERSIQSEADRVWVESVLPHLERLGWCTTIEVQLGEVLGGAKSVRGVPAPGHLSDIDRICNWCIAAMRRVADEYDRLGYLQLAQQYRSLITRIDDRTNHPCPARRLKIIRFYMPPSAAIALSNMLCNISPN